jgi:hypothetical protein
MARHKNEIMRDFFQVLLFFFFMVTLFLGWTFAPTLFILARSIFFEMDVLNIIKSDLIFQLIQLGFILLSPLSLKIILDEIK